jgi:RHS repeat-associated protein
MGGTTSFTYDAAGNQTRTNVSGEITDWTYDDASRLSRIERPSTGASSDFFYDGRRFLRFAEGRVPDTDPAAIFCDGFESGDTTAWGSGPGTCFQEPDTVPTYGSEGLLNAKDSAIVLYFASRPVALIGAGVEYISVDHLGTPNLLTNAAAFVVWGGGFEPFGEDFAGALSAGLFLGLPGQWISAVWSVTSFVPDSLYYNVHRWYQSRTGRYTRVDPVRLGIPKRTGRTRTGLNPYQYALSNPLGYLDPDGRQSRGGAFLLGIEIGLADARVCRELVNEAAARGQDEMGWPWAHCWASCMLNRYCGGEGVAKTLGFAKELLDVPKCFGEIFFSDSIDPEGNCASAFQESDFEDNNFGIECPDHRTCDHHCEQVREDFPPPPGPMFRFEIGVHSIMSF